MTLESLTFEQQQEIKRYGCTVDQMQQAVEATVDFRVHGPGLRAAILFAIGIMSGCQELIDQDSLDNTTKLDVQQALNRAKWVLKNYSF
jgi:hypothetical protein